MPYGIDPTGYDSLDATHDYLIDGNDPSVWCPHEDKPYTQLRYMCTSCCQDYLDNRKD